MSEVVVREGERRRQVLLDLLMMGVSAEEIADCLGEPADQIRRDLDGVRQNARHMLTQAWGITSEEGVCMHPPCRREPGQSSTGHTS